MKVLPRVLAIVSALILPVALVAVWADRAVTQTSAYVEVVGPLAEDDAVQDAASARVAAATNGLLRDRLGAATATAAADATARAATDVVESDAFAQAWRRANRTAHREFRRQMRSDASGPIVLDLSVLVEAALDGIRDTGAQVPAVDTGSALRVRLASSGQTGTVRTAYGAIDTFGLLTVAGWALLLLSALLLGRDRRAVLGFAAGATALTTALLWAAVTVGQGVAAGRVSATDEELTGAVLDVVTADLRLWALVAAGVSMVVAVLAALLPRSRRTEAA